MLTPLSSVWAGVAPGAAIGDRVRYLRNMKIHTVIIALLATASVVLANSTPEAEKHSERLLKSIETGDFVLFVQDGEPAFQKIEKKSFDSVVSQLATRMKEGYETTYLGTLDQQGYSVTLWKLDFSEGDDALATLSIKDGKVGGYWIK